jgi:hypothetical protein
MPATRMKRRKHAKENGPPHLVPLPRQAVEILRELRRLTGHQPFVFQGVRDQSKTISENTLNAALSALGLGPAKMRMHGFRAAARTMLAARHQPGPVPGFVHLAVSGLGMGCPVRLRHGLACACLPGWMPSTVRRIAARRGFLSRWASERGQKTSTKEQRGAPFFSENGCGTWNGQRRAGHSTGKDGDTLYKSTT